MGEDNRCDTCKHWEAPGGGNTADIESEDMGLCALISGSGQDAMSIGQDGKDADFLCAGRFGCSLWQGNETEWKDFNNDEYSMDKGGDAGTQAPGRGAPLAARREQRSAQL